MRRVSLSLRHAPSPLPLLARGALGFMFLAGMLLGAEIGALLIAWCLS